jgi:hypothetical protein
MVQLQRLLLIAQPYTGISGKNGHTFAKERHVHQRMEVAGL